MSSHSSHVYASSPAHTEDLLDVTRVYTHPQTFSEGLCTLIRFIYDCLNIGDIILRFCCKSKHDSIEEWTSQCSQIIPFPSSVLSPVSSPVSSVLSPSSSLRPPLSSLSCLLSPAFCLLTPASSHLPPHSCLLTPVSSLLFPQSCLHCPIPSVFSLYPIFCRLTPASSLSLLHSCILSSVSPIVPSPLFCLNQMLSWNQRNKKKCVPCCDVHIYRLVFVMWKCDQMCDILEESQFDIYSRYCASQGSLKVWCLRCCRKPFPGYCSHRCLGSCWGRVCLRSCEWVWWGLGSRSQGRTRHI